jgi:DNA-binding PadR family transcriptional regulator
MIFRAAEDMALKQIELFTLVAVLRLGDEAYGVRIHDETERVAGRGVSMAGVYSALERLERQGLTRSWLSEPRAEPGGRARRHYTVTASGRTLVREERERARRMWRGVTIDAPDRKR